MLSNGKGSKIVSLVLGVFAYVFNFIAVYARLAIGSELWIFSVIIGLALGIIGLALGIAGLAKRRTGLGILALIIDIWMVVSSITILVVLSIPGLM